MQKHRKTNEKIWQPIGHHVQRLLFLIRNDVYINEQEPARKRRSMPEQKEIYVTKIKVNKVRHLQNLEISLSSNEKKHLILTGKNGSGKTSLLDAISVFLNSVTTSDQPMDVIKTEKLAESNLKYALNSGAEEHDIRKQKNTLAYCKELIKKSTGGLMLEMNTSLYDIKPLFSDGKFVVSYYKADRIFSAQIPEYVEKVNLKKGYRISENPRHDFLKYLLDLKMTQALAASNNKPEKAERIKEWFDKFQQLLRDIFENDTVRLIFDEDTFRFSIEMDGREPFDFNTLSSGYAAVLDIVVDLIIRMESQGNRVFDFTVPGIVLIDEIETHLHLELQKKILGMLTTIFPTVQFIVSAHSPFILNSLENAVIYDLEKHLLVENGLANIPYEGIVEGYFESDCMSDSLKEKFEQYKYLATKKPLTDDDLEQISRLEMHLDEIPDYLALGITTEYQRLKAQLRNREDI